MRSSRERFGRVRGRFRFEIAGIARLPSRVYKIIHIAVFVGADLCLRVTDHAGSVSANAAGSGSLFGPQPGGRYEIPVAMPTYGYNSVTYAALRMKDCSQCCDKTAHGYNVDLRIERRREWRETMP
jgi:hypothetical protein